MTKFAAVPAGHVLVRLEDLAALLANQTPPPAPITTPRAVNWSALAASVALVANKLDDTGATNAELTRDVPPEAVTDVLVLILASALKSTTTDRGAGLLRALGLLAASESGP